MATSRSKPVTQATPLDAVQEEVEMSETQTTGSIPKTSGRKRKAIADDDDEMDGVEEALATSGPSSRTGSAGPPSKRMAIENVSSIDRTQQSTSIPSTTAAKPPSTLKNGSVPGAQPGKPDTDDAFLKAVASTKRGKKNEDNFDREFNKLKISRPELEREDQEDRQWAVLEDFGDDSNIRGNFMMIVEFDAPRHRTRAPQERNPEWDGKPNFKKFKKVGMACVSTGNCAKRHCRKTRTLRTPVFRESSWFSVSSMHMAWELVRFFSSAHILPLDKIYTSCRLLERREHLASTKL